MANAEALLAVRVCPEATARHLNYTMMSYKTSADPEATHSSWLQPASAFAKDLASKQSCCSQLSQMCPLVRAGSGVRGGQPGLFPWHSILLRKLHSGSTSVHIPS